MKLPETFTRTCAINAVVETPRGSSNKYTYDPVNEFFKLKKILPAGTSFPFDFGFIPGTLASDGDPLDVLIIAEEPFCQGAVVECKVIGVLEAIQQGTGKKERNDRIIAVASASHHYSHLQSISDMNKEILKGLIGFFEYYNSMEGKNFEVKATKGPEAAIKLIQKQITKKHSQ